MSEPRDFPTILNEWTNTLVEINKRATGAEALPLIARIGPLGQKLIYEAYNQGMDKTVALLKEEHDAKMERLEPTTESVQ